MRPRTAVKTGRSPALQVQQLRMREGSFSRYAAMVERVPVFLAWLVAALLAVGSVGCRAQADDKTASEDASITQRVQRAIAKDAVLKGMDIKVETQDGVVNLTGFVRSLENIAKAGELAHAVHGVIAVKNHLRVANQPSRARAPAAAARILL